MIVDTVADAFLVLGSAMHSSARNSAYFHGNARLCTLPEHTLRVHASKLVLLHAPPPDQILNAE
eukprot:4928157-Pleurochrysis_carterae.AAC.3